MDSRPRAAAQRPRRRAAPASADRQALPTEAYATCLAGLTGMGPTRLAAILAIDTPEAAWARLRRGRGWGEREAVEALGPQPTRVSSLWQREAREVDPADGVGAG